MIYNLPAMLVCADLRSLFGSGCPASVPPGLTLSLYGEKMLIANLAFFSVDPRQYLANPQTSNGHQCSIYCIFINIMTRQSLEKIGSNYFQLATIKSKISDLCKKGNTLTPVSFKLATISTYALRRAPSASAGSLTANKTFFGKKFLCFNF